MSFCFICLFKQQLQPRVVARITSHRGILKSITLKTAGCLWRDDYDYESRPFKCQTSADWLSGMEVLSWDPIKMLIDLWWRRHFITCDAGLWLMATGGRKRRPSEVKVWFNDGDVELKLRNRNTFPTNQHKTLPSQSVTVWAALWNNYQPEKSIMDYKRD